MSAPQEKTIKDLTGDWVMNKSLSDDTDVVLALQGIGWLSRKAIGLATITLHVKQYEEEGATHIDIESTLTGGIKGMAELRTLTWTYRNHEDHLFGKVKGRSRWVNLADVEDEWQKEDWLDGEAEKAGPNGEHLVQSYVENNERGWTADQIWGFAMTNGARYYTRRAVVKKGSTTLKVRLVYDWQGK